MKSNRAKFCVCGFYYIYIIIKLYRYQIFPYLITYTFDYVILIFFLGDKKKRKRNARRTFTHVTSEFTTRMTPHFAKCI